MSEVVFKKEAYEIMGACFAVYNDKGCGFLESVYQECLEIELECRGIPFIAKPKLNLKYRNRPLKSTFEPDLVCFDKIIVELKAVSALVPEHESQVLNYLSATGHQLGLLVNFGTYPGVEHKRLASTKIRGLEQLKA